MLGWLILLGLLLLNGAIVGGLLVLRQRARSDERRRKAIELAAHDQRAEHEDVVVLVRPALKLFVRSNRGLGLFAYAEDATDLPARDMARRLVAQLRPLAVESNALLWGPAAAEGPPSSRGRQLAGELALIHQRFDEEAQQRRQRHHVQRLPANDSTAPRAAQATLNGNRPTTGEDHAGHRGGAARRAH